MAATGMELTSYNTFTILSLVSLLMKVVTAEIGQPINDLADFSAALSRIQNTLEFEKGNIYKYLHETFAECANIESNADAFGKAGHFSKSSGKADHAVFMKDVTCSWTGSWNKLSLKSVTLSVKKGDLVFVAGSVGCGKSSLLYAILQELPLSTGKISIQGKIAWVSQQPWVFSGTIRENILFGVAFDPRRYQMVLKACALSKDLQRFPNGDMTRVGERGILLSGGQRARVELARAVYSDADIYLLDDPLSAVDTKVGHHIFNMCIDRILHDKTRLIVTHNLQIIRDAENIVVMKNGSILGKGDLPSLLRSGLDLSDMEYSRAKEGAFLPKKTALAEEENNEKDSIPDENFVGLDNVAEDREVGSISWKLYWHIIQVGAYPVLAAVLLIVFALVQASLILPDWWLLQLTSRSHDPQRQTKDLYIYGYLVCAAVLLSVMRAFAFLNTLINSSRNIHNTMLSVVLKAPVLFFDTNPAGRVLNRFSRDIGILDELLPDSFLNAAQFVLFAFAAVVLQSLLNPWIILPAIPVAVICLLCGRYYLKSSRDLRRLEAISRSPVLSHFSDTLEGLVSIRAYKREDAFLQDLYRYQDEHNKTWFAILSTNRWLGMRLDIVCVIFVAFVIVFAVGTHGGSGITALAVVYALQLVGTLQYGVKKCAEVENYMTSVERVLTYTQIDPEPGYENQNQPPKDWPLYGEVRTKDLGLVYYQGGPKVLKDVSFTIDPHEKVGIVGRTGAGKSSLIAALFRMPQPTGDVVIDDVNIGDINIQSARRAVAVITQNPVLFTGSLRMNLDPFDEYEDKELWDALEEANLKNMVRNLPRQLNEEVKECGANLSVGERQLLCLARALLKKNKIIVMDEATANVDHKTDQLIQDTIRTKFKHCTVITIAHRLNTIMNYDRVLVLENGRVVEYDKPEILLRNQSGVFSGLCHYYMGSDKVEK